MVNTIFGDKTEVTAEELLAAIKKVPENRWRTGDFIHEESQTCCMVGHGNRLLSDNPEEYTASNCGPIDDDEFEFIPPSQITAGMRRRKKLRNVWSDMSSWMRGLRKPNSIYITPVIVNDEKSVLYPQPTTKKRVVAMMTDYVTYLKSNNDETKL